MNVFDLVAKISVDDTKFKTGLTKLRDELKSVGPQTGNMVQQVGAKMQILGKAFMPISMVAGAMLVPAVKGAMDFEDQIAKVRTLIDETKYNTDGLADMFIKLSNESGRSTSELTEAGYQALSAGVKFNQMNDFLQTAVNLSKVGFTETATAVDVLTTSINAYGDKALTAEEYANRLVLTQNKGKTTVDELAASMGRVIPTAAGLGVSFDNLATAYVALTSQGMSTRISTTYLNALLQELGKTGSTVSDVLYNQTGKSFTELMNEGNSLGDIISMLGLESAGLSDKMKQLTDSGIEPAEALEQLAASGDANAVAFMNMFGSSTAASAALSLLNYGADEFNNTMNEMADSDSVMAEALEKLNTNGAKLRKTLNELKNLFLVIGSNALDVLAPAIESVGNFIGDLVVKFTEAPKGVQKFISVVLMIATAIGPVLLLGGKLMTVFGGIPSMFSGIGGAISSVVESFQILGMATIGPILAVVAAIAGIIAILVHAYNTNEEFRDKVNAVWQHIKSKVMEAIKTISSYWDFISGSMGDNWKKVAADVMPIIDGLVQFIDGAIQTIMPIVSAVLDYIQTYISTFISVITAIIQVGMALISGDWDTAWQAIQNLVNKVINGILNIVSSTLNVIGSVVQVAFNLMLSIISTVLSSIWSVITSIWNGILTTISNVVNNIKTSVQNKFNSIKSAISNVVNSIKTVVGNAFNAAKTAMTQPIETAKNTIKGIVDKIKGLFPISITKAFNLPKLPSISISQGKKKVGPVEVPYPILSWNAKAMASGLLLNGATIFGMNGNRLLGGGEAGPELVVGKNNLMRMISEAQGGGISDEAMASMLQFMASNLSEEAITRAFVKGASQIDWQLIINNREFGRAVKAVSY